MHSKKAYVVVIALEVFILAAATHRIINPSPDWSYFSGVMDGIIFFAFLRWVIKDARELQKLNNPHDERKTR